MHFCLTSWDSLVSSLRTNLWYYLIPSGRTVQILVESKVHILFFYQGGDFYYCTHVPGPVSQSSAEIEYNETFNLGMVLAHSIIINNELLNKDTYVVPEQSPLIILDIKSAVCMGNNCKDTQHTRHIFRRMYFVINGEQWNLYKTL